MKTLHIDIETYSSADLPSCGVYRYTEAPDFEILLFGYSVDGGPVRVVDLACGETLPEEVLAALTDDGVLKWAHNVMFERVCLSRWLRNLGVRLTYLSPKSWRCSMIWAATLSLPLSLEAVGEVLGLEKQKLSEGKDLIRFFCVPCTPTIFNGMRSRSRPSDAPEKWAAFKRYNIRDVEVEMAICEKLRHFPVPERVWEEFLLDQEINDRGVGVDTVLVKQALRMDARSQDELTRRLKALTGLENPNSVPQLKAWLLEQGLELNSLEKKEVQEALRGMEMLSADKTSSVSSLAGDRVEPPSQVAITDCSPLWLQTCPRHVCLTRRAPEGKALLQEVLKLRLQIAKSSVKKYQAMDDAVCADGRARGMFQFYGSRTGRWSGRLIQLQNLPQNKMPDLEKARALVRQGDSDAVELLYGDVPDTLSQLVRTAFIPESGKKFIVADYSSIEARVLAWYAGESWREKVFRNEIDLYCASASQMFHVPVEKNGVNAHLRQKGKIAELALGYGGSVGALRAMGALELGLKIEELQPLVDRWRFTNPNIVRFWREVDRAAVSAVRQRSDSSVAGIHFQIRGDMLRLTLPSGRSLCYLRPRLALNRFGAECVTFEGLSAAKKWERQETFGAKLVENIVQATARDLLCHAMRELRGCRVVMHVHDELVIEAEKGMPVQEVCDRMSRTPPWAEGLLLKAEGFEAEYYRK